MRKIKFRGLSLYEERQWIYGLFFKSGSEGQWTEVQTESGQSIYVDPETISQYTGLKDKNSREIYEKDVLDVQGIGYPFVPSWKGIVKFIDGSYLIENLEGTNGEYLFDETREVEIIGNVYEDAHLLEVKA